MPAHANQCSNLQGISWFVVSAYLAFLSTRMCSMSSFVVCKFDMLSNQHGAHDDRGIQKPLLFTSFVHVVRCKLEQRREGYDLACTRIRDDHSDPTFAIFITKSFGSLSILVPQVGIESIDFTPRANKVDRVPTRPTPLFVVRARYDASRAVGEQLDVDTNRSATPCFRRAF